MLKLLKKKILFALNSEPDLGYHPYSFLYFRLSEFEPGSVRDAVFRLNRQGAVDKLTRNNQTQVRLTSLGKDLLTEAIGPLEASKTPWDRRWRLVILDGAGKQQNSLFKALKALSYRRLTRGVYVTPLAVTKETKELFLTKNWQNLAQIVETRRLILADDLQWARKLWPLKQLNRDYQAFVSLADRLLKISRKNNILLRQSKGGFKQVFDRYFYLASHDPVLPRKLLPPGWPDEEAKGLFERLVTLAKTAGI